MTLRKWFHLFVLTISLVITDQFFKIASRYLTPTRDTQSKISVVYREQPGWIHRTENMTLSQAFKTLLATQNGVFTLLILLMLLSMFHKSQRTIESRFVLPYACVSAAIVSLWIDNIGVWSPQSVNISWLHVTQPLQLNLSWAQVYLGLGVLLFFWRARRNEMVQ